MGVPSGAAEGHLGLFPGSMRMPRWEAIARPLSGVTGQDVAFR